MPNNIRLEELDGRMHRIEDLLSTLSENVGLLGTDVGQAYGLLAQSYDRLEQTYNQILQRIAFSETTYLGNNRALTYLKTGHKIFVDTTSIDIGTHLMFGGEWESQYTNAFMKLLKEGNNVLDIGANHGVYSLLAASKVAPSGHVYAFEASRSFFNLIMDSVSVNGLSNIVTVVHSAVADRDFETTMVFDKHYSGGGHLMGEKDDVITSNIEQRIKTEKVHCISLDNYFSNTNINIDAIKMDIEGAEGLAIKGMLNLIEKSPDLKMMIEFCPSMFSRFEIDTMGVIELLQSRQFKSWLIQPDSSLVHVEWLSLLNNPDLIQNIMVSRQDL